MAKKLFVGNLPFSITDDALMALFATYGTVVSANLVKDRYSGRSKGYAFIEFDTDEAAAAAMAALDGSDQGGRNIAVKEALPRPEKDGAPVTVTPAAEPEAPTTEEPEAPADEPAAEEPAKE